MTTICTTVECVSRAVQRLLGTEYVILDCEGRKLGLKSGELSLISIGTPQAKHVYQFDLPKLNRDALRLLFDSILSSGPSARVMTKVMWDGRLDYLGLLHHFNCPLENVLDLQLADVYSRFQRKTNLPENRIYRFVRDDFPLKEVRKYQISGIHVLSNIDNALKEHRIHGVRRRSASIKHLNVKNVSQLRASQPLRQKLFEFSVDEIKRIAKIYDHFHQRGYLKHMEYLRAKQMEYLRDLSARYSAMQRQIAGRPEDIDIFTLGPYLPLSISLEAEPGSERASEPGPTKECSQCKRMIPEQHFPFERHPRESRKAEYNPRTSICKVCTLILGRLQYVEKQARDEEAKKLGHAGVNEDTAMEHWGRSSYRDKPADAEGKARKILDKMMN